MSPIWFLLLLFNFSHQYALKDVEEKQLNWPKEYHVKGEKFDFHTDVLLSFEIWYSEGHNKSRVDLDNGNVQNYYDPELMPISKYSFAMHPVTKNNVDVESVCYVTELNYRDLLLNSTYFTYTGQSTVLFDKDVDEWSRSETVDEIYTRNQTIYVYTTDEGYTLPLRMIQDIYIHNERGLMKQTVIDYHHFDFEVNRTIFNLPGDITRLDCIYGDVLKNNGITTNEQYTADDFDKFMCMHNKQYEENEVKSRKNIFEDNLKLVTEHNSKNLGFRLEMNAYSDGTDDEFKFMTGAYNSEEEILRLGLEDFQVVLDEDDELPESYDARDEGIVSTVKNQGYCGSCWAFAAVGAAEVAIGKAKGKKLLDLSEQTLIDCTWRYNNGCQGGMTTSALSWIKDNGIPLDTDYGGYKSIDSVCRIQNMTDTYTIDNFKLIFNKPLELKKAIYKYGAVGVYIYASNYMKLYADGLYYEEYDCKDRKYGTNHAVVLVGYGVHEGEDYWLVKNSWGDHWGEAGFMRMSAKNCFVADVGIVPLA